MAIARGNLAGIKQYSDAIKSGQEQLDNAMNQVKASIDSSLQDINKEKTKADKVKETCAKGISKVSQKIDELKSKLNDLESELASTQPEIEEHYTDDDGNTHTITKPNPKYHQLLSEIAQVQEELNKYKKLLSQLNDLVKKIDNQIDTLEQSQKKIGDLKEKLVGVKRNSYELLADALIKLNKIQDAISRYMSVKIEAPNLNFGHNKQNNKPQLNNNIDKDAEINDDEIIKESDLEIEKRYEENDSLRIAREKMEQDYQFLNNYRRINNIALGDITTNEEQYFIDKFRESFENYKKLKDEYDYGQVRMDDAVADFNPYQWSVYGEEEKKGAIERFANYCSVELNLKNKPDIDYYNGKEGDFGWSSEGKIGINLNETEDPCETIDTIAHENRHQYQRERSQNPLSDEEYEWRANFDKYIEPEESKIGYIEQPVEVDARDYATIYTHFFRRRYNK